MAETPFVAADWVIHFPMKKHWLALGDDRFFENDIPGVTGWCRLLFGSPKKYST